MSEFIQDCSSVAVFDMLVERISDLEDNMHQIFQFLREPHMKLFQLLDPRLFKWVIGNCQISVRYDAPVQVCLHTPGKHNMMLLRVPSCVFVNGATIPKIISIRENECFLWLESKDEQYVDWFMNYAVSVLLKLLDFQQLPPKMCVDAWPLLSAAKAGIYATVNSLSFTEIRSAIDFHMKDMSYDQRWLYVWQHPVCQVKSRQEMLKGARRLSSEETKCHPNPWDGV